MHIHAIQIWVRKDMSDKDKNENMVSIYLWEIGLFSPILLAG